MAKPTFNPVAFEQRNQIPVAVSEAQADALGQVTGRVNAQLDWVAQLLGWSGPNYWGNLPSTVHEKRALLSGTFGVYNSYTVCPLVEIRNWDQKVVVETRPNIAIGQRVLIGDVETFIYGMAEEGPSVVLDLGKLTDKIVSYLEQGIFVRIDIPANRPFPFYRPEPEASANASFRCSVGLTRSQNEYYKYADLVLSPYSADNILLPYDSLTLYCGAYYYFDRAVYVGTGESLLIPWIEAQWIESAGLWEIYIPEDIAGNSFSIVWDYPVDAGTQRVIASKRFQAQIWRDPSDWGFAPGGNPVTDRYYVEKKYDVAGLNYALNSVAELGDEAPPTGNLWFDAGANILYARSNGNWVRVGQVTKLVNLQGVNAPPPSEYALEHGLVWSSPEGATYLWDGASPQKNFYDYFPSSFDGQFFIIEPSYISDSFIYYNPDEFYVYNPDSYVVGGFPAYRLLMNAEGFYVTSADIAPTAWYQFEFDSTSQEFGDFLPAYGNNLELLVDGVPAPYFLDTPNYQIEWAIREASLEVSYLATTPEGEYRIPRLVIHSLASNEHAYVDITADFVEAPNPAYDLPATERGPLNNFLGVWGNKGGALPLDFAFDALDIHGFNEHVALGLKPVNQPIKFDALLKLVTGAEIFVGDQPPVRAKLGDYYWNNENGVLAVYYKDRDGTYLWVEIDSPTSVCQIDTIPRCDYFPLKPILTTGSCTLETGDTFKDPLTPSAAVFYESPNGSREWVQLNWNTATGIGWDASVYPDPEPDFSVLDILIVVQGNFVVVEPGTPYVTSDFEFGYTIDPIECTFTFTYLALTPAGVQTLPTVFVGATTGDFPPQSITDQIFANVEYTLTPAVQNAETTLRPWKNRSLEVTTVQHEKEHTYSNGLIADLNKGPGDENWTKSFVRLPAEYGRSSVKWAQSELIRTDFTYAGYDGSQMAMDCPTQVHVPQIYEQVVFFGTDSSVGTVLFSAPFWYSDIDGIDNVSVYLDDLPYVESDFNNADIDFASEILEDEWYEADLTDYDPLHSRSVFANGEWDGIYVEPTGTRALSGYVEKDIRVKSVITMAPPIWDASIYRYAPLCPQSEASYAEDVNNCKVGYAYFAADLAAAEDGFFDQSKDVAWREPLEPKQTLYMLNS